MRGCRYNTCSICGFASDCEIHKAYETQKNINKQCVDETEELKLKIIELKEENQVLSAHLRG